MFKKIVCLFSLTLLLGSVSCKKENQNATETETAAKTVTETPPAVTPAEGKYPVMTFDTTEHDFGTIATGDKVEYLFNFKNTGTADLIITNAVGSCGCTIPEYPKVPIKPGESGQMKVSFNSAGKTGLQQKSVTITTNTEKGTESLLIKASIK